jgi:hypothetical protein
VTGPQPRRRALGNPTRAARGAAGRVLGLDLPAAHEVARACGHDLATVSELPQAAEAGLLEALNEATETDRSRWPEH